MKISFKDKNNFKSFNEQEYFYTDSSNNLYFKSLRNQKFELIKDVDLNTVAFLNKSSYFYDKDRIFYESKCIKYGYSTFKDYKKYGYFKVDNVLYWGGKKIKTDFTEDLINISDNYFTDNEHLFINGEIFNFEKENFIILNRFYAKDSTKVFCSSRIIDLADAETFKVIRVDSGYTQEFLAQYSFIMDKGFSSWTCDKNNLYFCGEPFLTGVIDPLTTKIIRNHILILTVRKVVLGFKLF